MFSWQLEFDTDTFGTYKCNELDRKDFHCCSLFLVSNILIESRKFMLYFSFFVSVHSNVLFFYFSRCVVKYTCVCHTHTQWSENSVHLHIDLCSLQPILRYQLLPFHQIFPYNQEKHTLARKQQIHKYNDERTARRDSRTTLEHTLILLVTLDW